MAYPYNNEIITLLYIIFLSMEYSHGVKVEKSHDNQRSRWKNSPFNYYEEFLIGEFKNTVII